MIGLTNTTPFIHNGSMNLKKKQRRLILENFSIISAMNVKSDMNLSTSIRKTSRESLHHYWRKKESAKTLPPSSKAKNNLCPRS
jgi:hypothetical protein